MNASFEDLIYLCSCSVNNTVPDAARVGTMDLTALYQTAEQHMLTAAAAAALESAGIRDKAFIQASAKAIRKAALMDADQTAILNHLEEAGIWYMPLKGAVLKDLYPALGMRQMSDRDILVDSSRMEDVRSIMLALGFEIEEYDQDYHDCYFKKPVSNFEMHRKLVGPMNGKAIYVYYQSIQDHLLQDPDHVFERHFSPEDFYIFMIVHEYNHYMDRGTGLRSLLDTYVFLKRTEIDQAYVTSELEKLGIADFEHANRNLALHLFGGTPLTQDETRFLEKFYDAGTYGLEEIREQNQLQEKGRLGYFLSRLTLPYDRMLEIYPILKKASFLYPLCWLHRLIHALLFKNRKVLRQLKAGLTWKGKE